MQMDEFEKAYANLNDAQKQAVDAIDGPVLVIAGPGTGKTQLLSARVAKILKETDTLPQNILCLTFTESGAENMRARLSRFIGQHAYDVQIGTYHSFGSDVIRRFPEYFTQTRLQSPIDELGKRQIMSEIIDNLSYRNPLKQTRHHLGDLMNTISEIKRGLLSSDDLRTIASSNIAAIVNANKRFKMLFKDFKRMPTKIEEAEASFAHALTDLNALPKADVPSPFLNLATLAAQELSAALEEAEASGKTKPLTAWKNNWLAKNEDNEFVLDDRLATERIRALADVLEAYQTALSERGLYDFDDMILRAITALEANKDLKFTLQEQYQYVLLDEFQDTNAAQLRLVELLTDNPANEGRPNVLAVGDDDQAIYAFQGAQYSNMLDYFRLYRDVLVVNLTENYRSTGDIISTAEALSGQIVERLESQLDGVEKTLAAANLKLPKSIIERREFLSDISQFAAVAQDIKKLIERGTAPSEIAVLAPKHRQLEPLVPYLQKQGIPVRYEKRENILEAPVVRQIITMSRLVLALHDQDEAAANSLWPEVLSYDFWQLPTSEIWKLSWQASDTKTTWSQLLLEDGSKFRTPALLLMSLAYQVETETLETILDALIGNSNVITHETDLPSLRSPLRDFYTSQNNAAPGIMYQTVTQITVLRAKLRDHQGASAQTLMLPDLLSFIAQYEEADERMINTSPYNEGADAVQLMTVFKAKGLEFDHVFLVACQDDVWGGSSRGQSNKLTLPRNLAPIRHAGTTDDERLRLLFVAVTRARYGLHLMSFSRTYGGRTTKRLKYFNEVEEADGTITTGVLPASYNQVQQDGHEAPLLEQLELNWQSRHQEHNATLDRLLQDRLRSYRLSPTNLLSFIDLEYAGPQAFFLSTLLRFPTAPSTDGAFGTAIHETLEWLQFQVTENNKLPPLKTSLDYFTTRMKGQRLSPGQTAIQTERGLTALTAYLAARGHIFKPGDQAEHNFWNEGVVIDGMHMSGKVDRMEINKDQKTITVVDYKTGGTPYNRWQAVTKLHRYRLQLYCYKLLIEGSHSFAGYTVDKGRLEFIEPDNEGRIHSLELAFDDNELAETKQLLKAMWDHVHKLSFPDTGKYPSTLTGIQTFEQDLREGKI